MTKFFEVSKGCRDSVLPYPLVCGLCGFPFAAKNKNPISSLIQDRIYWFVTDVSTELPCFTYQCYVWYYHTYHTSLHTEERSHKHLMS